MDLNLAIMGILGKSTTSNMIKTICKSKTPVINEITDVNMIQEDVFYNNNVYIFLNSYDSSLINGRLKELIKGIPADRLFIANADDKILLDILAVNNSTPVITFGLNGKSTITASSLSCTRESTRFIYCLQRNVVTFSGRLIEPFEYPFELKMVGNFHVYNALAAITASIFMDKDICDVRRSLKKLTIKHNMEVVYDNRFTIIDNRCMNIYSLEKVFESLQFIDYNKLIVVCQLIEDSGFNDEMKNSIENWCDALDIKKVIFISSDIKQSENINKDGKEVFFNNMGDSLRCAIENAFENDMILLMGGKAEHGAGEAIFDALYS